MNITEKNLTVKASNESLPEVIAFLDEFLESVDCPVGDIMKLELVTEEIFVNIANYAYDESEGNAEITAGFDGSSVSLTFIDSGRQYNPLEKDDPDITLSAEDRQIGGLGIFLVKKNTDEAEYEYKDGKNIFTVKKKIV